MAISQQVTLPDLTRRNVETIAKMEAAAADGRTRGERIADGFAAAVGSWTFIVTQSVVLMIWVAINLVAWARHWDPYPFILLNLALSFQAAYASPIIMMSQNRQSRILERRNHLDLQINMLSEQENTEMLRLLHSICDHLGVSVVQTAERQAFQQKTDPEDVVEQIKQVVEDPSGAAPASKDGMPV